MLQPETGSTVIVHWYFSFLGYRNLLHWCAFMQCNMLGWAWESNEAGWRFANDCTEWEHSCFCEDTVFLLSVCYFSSQRSFGWGICCIQSLSQVTCSVATQNQTSWQLWGQFCRVKGFVEEPPPGIVGISNVKTNMPCSKHKSQGSTISSDHVVLESRSKRKVFKWVGFLQAGFHEAWASRGSWGSTTIWNNLA